MLTDKWSKLAIASLIWTFTIFLYVMCFDSSIFTPTEWVIILVFPLLTFAIIVVALDYLLTDIEKKFNNQSQKLKSSEDEINFLKLKLAKSNRTQGVSSSSILNRALIQDGNISSAPAYPELYKTTIEQIEKSLGWLHLKGSVLGFNKTELQDSHEYCIIDDAALLIVADGAGSKRFSKRGADYCVKTVKAKFEASRHLLASIKPDEWNNFASDIIYSVSVGLSDLAIKDEIQVSELGSTCIIVYANQKFVACSHVGDGRAGYLDDDGVWKSLMTPFKGSEANATVFITSLSPENKHKYILTQIVEKRVRGIVALSDGPESVCWNVSTKDVTGTKIVDPNLPAGLFFEKISNQLIAARRSNVTQEELDKLWNNFLKDGNASLASQVDDKTIVFALRG